MSDDSKWIKLKIVTTNKQFQGQFKNPSDFFRKLSNSKLGLSGGAKNNNRIFWQRNFMGGIYYFLPQPDGKLEILFFIEMYNSEKIDGLNLSLKCRIKRLVKSLDIEFEMNRITKDELLDWEQKLAPFRFQSQYFGDCYKRGCLL